MNMNDWQQQIQYFLIERRMLVVSAAIGAASLLLIALGIWPAWQKIQKNAVAIRRLEQQVAKSSQRVTILSDLKEADQEHFDRVSIALPEFKQPLHNLMAINTIASHSGVIIEDYNLNPGVVSTDSAQPEAKPTLTAQGVEIFKFEVTFSGSLEQIKEAFSQIESSLPLMDISQFDLSSSIRDEENYQVTLSIFSRYAAISSEAVAKQPVTKLNAEQLKVLEALQGYSLPGEGSDILPQQYDNQELFGGE